MRNLEVGEVGFHAETRLSRRQGVWIAVWALLVTAATWVLYWWTAAPGLTWAHFGADGGDLLAAAATGGVPHPPGYPLYTLLLRAWLAAGAAWLPNVEPARLGNLFSAATAALSAGFTMAAAWTVCGPGRARALIALAAGLLWAVTPLVWGQALITEVYAGHALLTAALGWALLARPGRVGLIAALITLGTAHHLTFLLLLPAAFYWLLANPVRRVSAPAAAAWLGGGVAFGALFYLRIPWAASAQPLPPVNWGYADNWRGLFWLVSGAAYRHYLFGYETGGWLAHVAAWARTLTTQFTAVGLAVAVLGLAVIDRQRPVLRTFSLLWVVPVSLYAISYATWDSEVYLLPAVWMATIWLAAGLAALAALIEARGWMTPGRAGWLIGAAALAGVAALVALRLPALSLTHDTEARTFLDGVTRVVEPGSLVLSNGDAETFAVWYGAWGSGELLAAAPGVIVVNYSLYQFEWYRRLLRDLYPQVVEMGEPIDQLLAASAGRRPVYVVDPLLAALPGRLEPAGAIWKYVPE